MVANRSCFSPNESDQQLYVNLGISPFDLARLIPEQLRRLHLVCADLRECDKRAWLDNSVRSLRFKVGVRWSVFMLSRPCKFVLSLPSQVLNFERKLSLSEVNENFNALLDGFPVPPWFTLAFPLAVKIKAIEDKASAGWLVHLVEVLLAGTPEHGYWPHQQMLQAYISKETPLRAAPFEQNDSFSSRRISESLPSNTCCETE